ncbi:MAG: head-tail joining protein [bacterium]
MKFNPFPEFPKSKNRIIIEQYRYELIGEVSLESTTPYVLAQASSVSNDAQGDTLVINGTTYTVVEDHPNG